MRRFAIAFVAVTLMTTGPVWAQSSEPPGPGDFLDPETKEQAERLVRESIEKMMQAMELFIESIPQYEAPEITPEGDIIIRRKKVPDETEIDFDATEESDT